QPLLRGHHLGVLGLVGEAVVGHHVGPRIEEHAVTVHAVASGAPDLLVVALDRARHVAVDDVADVGLVDAHAEGHGGHDDVAVVAAEGILGAGARPGLHAGVIGQRPHAVVAQELGHRLHRLARQAIDDAALPAPRLHEAQDRVAHAATPPAVG